MKHVVTAGLAIPALALVSCGPAAAPESEPTRIALDDAGPQQAMALNSPDTSDAFWTVSEDGQAIRFGNEGEPALLTLACDLDEGEQPQFRIIRHAEAFPGQSALFPFVGNGMTKRFLVDTVLADGEWRWEARLPASSAELEIFEGTREMYATLPGRGTLQFKPSRIPAEFLAWCRAGGQLPEVEGGEAQDTEPPAPAE